MEMEERTTIANDIPPVGGFAHSETTITASAPASDTIAPAQLWRDYLTSWIGGSHGQFLASPMHNGSEVLPAEARRDAVNHSHSGSVTTTGDANANDRGGETCVPMS
jgi:hypothetical protein